MAVQHFHTPDPVDLEISVPVGTVEVETVDGDESIVTVEGTEKLVEQTRVELHGRSLRVEFQGKKPFGIIVSIGDFSFGNSRLEITAKVPHRSAADLKTASADMKLRGRVASLTTNTASGDLSVQGEIEDDATLKTVSGDIRVDHVGHELKAQSVSGDVHVRTVGGSAQVKTVSGDIELESLREGEATMQTVSGDIDLGVAPGTNLDVDAGSVSGELASEVPLGSEASSISDDGPTLVVRGKTVSGDFRVRRAL